jgi:hypothetical protein
MTTNTNEILDLLKDLETTFGYTVYIPSLQKEIKFKQLTTEQLKTLYKSVINKAVLNLEFNTQFNEIIKQNCLDTDINIDKLTIYDKVLIFVKTRLECLSPEVKFFLTDEEIEQLDTSDNFVTISLLEHYNNFVNKKITFDQQTYEANNCSVICDIPTLDIENKFQVELTTKTLTDAETSELADIVGDTFVNEVTKFIIHLKVNDKNINLAETDFKTRIAIIKALPSALIIKVLEYITAYKQKINELLLIEIDVNNNILYKEIPLDASFYNI